jgi:hypothetical protein
MKQASSLHAIACGRFSTEIIIPKGEWDMNKLTTTNMITKVAPLTLLALIMSGSAFAGKPGQASIDVYNECKVKVYYYDSYGNKVLDPTTGLPVKDPRLVIKTKIKDVSDDSPGQKGSTPPEFEYNGLSVYGLQKVSKIKGEKEPNNRFDPLGNEYAQTPSTGTNTTTIHLCEIGEYDNPLNDTTSLLNADIIVKVKNARRATYESKCDDNPYTHCGLDAYGEPIVCEEKDESIVKVKPGICL